MSSNTMSRLKERKAATDARLDELKEARDASGKACCQQYKQTRADHDRR
jgi:hypothetical protein